MRRTTISTLLIAIVAVAPLRSFAGPGVGTIWDRDVPVKDRATIAAFYGGVVLAIGGAWAFDRLFGEKGGEKHETRQGTLLSAEHLEGVEDAAELLEREGMELAEGVTDKQVKLLRRLPGLRRLMLDKTSISANGLSVLADLKELEVLTLPTTANAEALKQLVAFKTLRDLSLSDAKLVNDDCIAILAKFSALKRLAIKGTSITDDGLTKLQALLPTTEIVR